LRGIYDLAADGKLFEAILFYQISSQYYLKDDCSSALAVDGVVSCVEGVYNVSSALSKSNTTRDLITTCLVPITYKLVQKLDDFTEKIDKKVFYSKKAWCFYFIGGCREMVGEKEAGEDTYKQGLRSLDENLEEEAKHCLIFAMLNRTLGQIQQSASNYEGAVNYYADAIASFKITRGVSDEKKRKKQIKTLESELKTVSNKLKKQKEQELSKQKS
jgi:hypothetical protein